MLYWLIPSIIAGYVAPGLYWSRSIYYKVWTSNKQKYPAIEHRVHHKTAMVAVWMTIVGWPFFLTLRLVDTISKDLFSGWITGKLADERKRLDQEITDAEEIRSHHEKTLQSERPLTGKEREIVSRAMIAANLKKTELQQERSLL